MTTRLRCLGVLAATLLLASPGLPAQGRAPSLGTLVVAHGGDSVWNSLVADAARAARTGGPVEVSFLMGPAAAATRFQDAVARLERQGVTTIAVVPMGTLRELPTICVDSSEFVVSKLKDRGSHQAFGVVTNAQDFMHILRLCAERELESS